MTPDAIEGFPPELVISPPDPPGGPDDRRPGDLSRFLRPGFGVGGPGIVMPWGGPGGDYYGFDAGGGDPITAAPRTESGGGAVYLHDRVEPAQVDVLLDVLGICAEMEFAAFSAHSDDPKRDNYLDQLRLVPMRALRALFGAHAPPPPQTLDLRAAVHAFLQAQRTKWGEGYTYPLRLSGCMGGDGDWAKEQLAFGLCAENTSWGVVRVWSRAWLVTK